MAYSYLDLEKVKKAELDLITGQRVVSLTFNGRTTTYQQADLADIRKLKRMIAAEIGNITAKISRVVVTTKCRDL